MLPALNVPEKGRNRIIEFRGYSNNPVIEDGEMREMKNLSSDLYPVLSQRPSRGTYMERMDGLSEILAWKEKLAYIANDVLYYDGEKITRLMPEERRILVGINKRLCVFPDKICYKIPDGDEPGKVERLDAHLSAAGGYTVTLTKNTMKITSGSGDPAEELQEFKSGDTVTVKGFENEAFNISARIVDIRGALIEFPENTFIMDADVEEYTATEKELMLGISMDRDVPDMDHVIEVDNRLWGCKGSTIYSCKLGDPKNWNDFQGLSSDSYALDVGTDGDFTGICSYATHICFFKENYIHKLFGSNKPSTYELATIRCLGLENGCHKSIQNINSVIYYKSREGIAAYDGSYPSLITQSFRYKYRNAVAGSDLMKYYVSMQRESGEWDFFALDLTKGLWHREDNTHAEAFAFLKGSLLFLTGEKILTVKNAIDEEPDIHWYAEFGPFDEYEENKKIYSMLKLRLDMSDGAFLKVSIKTDRGDWEDKYSMRMDDRRAIYLPLIPQRCDKFSVRLEGRGRTKIESLTRVVKGGSDHD